MPSESKNHNSIQKMIIDIVGNQLPLIVRSDLCHIMRHHGYSQKQFDAAVKRLKHNDLVRIGVRNTPAFRCVITALPSDGAIAGLASRLSSISWESDRAESKPIQIILAAPKIAGLSGRDPIGELRNELFYCYLRLARAFSQMHCKSVNGIDTWETEWPKRHSTQRVAYARFQTLGSGFINLAASYPRTAQEAEHWLRSLNGSGRKYVIC